MNWVWANSRASGNERLVLLALADACSRDDGTGCWPSAATIARKANISDRTVRRVIARLEAEGQVVVHRGGGRTGSPNSYTVVTGDRVIHSPWPASPGPRALGPGPRSPGPRPGGHQRTCRDRPPADGHRGAANAMSAPGCWTSTATHQARARAARPAGLVLPRRRTRHR